MTCAVATGNTATRDWRLEDEPVDDSKNTVLRSHVPFGKHEIVNESQSVASVMLL